MEPWSTNPTGRFEEVLFESSALLDNPLGDPTRRPLWLYLPPQYAQEPSRRFPSVYMIQGFTGQLDMWRTRQPLRRSFPELVDALFADEKTEPCIVVWVDCWTSLGGSQFLDSPATGRYHTYLCEEVVPWVDAHYRTSADRAHRGISGKSSGGYGAMVTAMLRPDLFGGFATHAGDALFEACYAPDFRRVVRSLRDEYQGSYERFWDDFRSRPAFSRASDEWLFEVWAMAACYSADPDGTVRLPFDLETAQIIPDVWERWLAWDPVRMVPRYADALRSLRAIYIDCGKRDQYFLDLGAEAFRRALEEIGVEDVHFDLFDATHTAIEYRYPIGLAYLANRLSMR